MLPLGRFGRVGIAFLMLAGTGAASEPVAAPALLLSLKPAASPAGGISTVAVAQRYDGIAVAAGAPLLRLPLASSTVESVAAALDDVSASDADGPLPLTARNVSLPEESFRDSEAGGPSREWIAGRASRGAITVRYTVPPARPPRGPAPPFALSDDGGALSAAGHVFLLLPPGNATYRTTIDWDLGALPAGSRGISSLGEGHVTAPEPLTGSQLRATFYMAGPIHTVPAALPDRGFFVAWQGTPPFDGPDLARWTAALYGDYARFFGQTKPPPYGVFLRYNPVNAGGGVGLHNAFVTTFGKAGGQGSDPKQVRFTLAHEMFHTFQPFIQQPGGLESSWFGEGLAVFYQTRLPLRFGLITPDDFIGDVNETAARYFTSIMATVPNSEVRGRFWSDTRIRTLPYDRGAMYFAGLDRAVRTASKGRRSLDDLMLEMLALQKSGHLTTNADWEAILARDLGAGAVAAFRAHLAGHVAAPPSDAYGPCFRRTTRPLRRYELGFEPSVLAQPQRIVRGLVAGAAAAQAGLRNGDEITVPIPQDAIQGDQHATITLKIHRDGKTFPITYLPRGETVQAYQWERVARIPDTSCKL